MRNPFRHSIPYDPAELLNSVLYDEEDFYKAFSKDLKHALRDVVIESPYLTIRRTETLIPLFDKLTRYGVRVRVDTRHPSHHDKAMREQAWQAVDRLRVIGVSVKFYDDMRHRKIAIIDGMVLWEGSLNIMSQNNSREVMRRIQSPSMAHQMAKFCSIDI
jgi:phosphatidylserine/phosphatidylglycerophosphate/cardiolipin synthase-like enzyme